MKETDIDKALAEIRAADQARDHEVAHELEDELLVAVLTAIANGAHGARALAKRVLQTQDHGYSRWYG